MSDIVVTPYQPDQQAAVLEIAADTAYFGEPVEAFLEDRRLFCDAFARYYTEHEASYAWVAQDSQGVIGFLFGCADTARQSRQWRGYILTEVLVNALKGNYKLGKLTASFAFWMLLGLIMGEEPKVDLSVYPAHLQINVRQGFRGKGVGRRLIEAYLRQLCGTGVAGVHLGTTSQNVLACHLYENLGFQLLGSQLNRYWSRRFGFRVDNKSYGMKLR